MVPREEVLGYEFCEVFFADLAERRVLKRGVSLSSPLGAKEFDVLIFFLERPQKVIPRTAVTPLAISYGKRSPTDDYISKIVRKLGVERQDLFRTIRPTGYSLVANVRPIFKSDMQLGHDLFKASELNFNTHTVDSMRLSLRQTLLALAKNPRQPKAHVTAAFNYINLAMAAYSAEQPRIVIPEARRHIDEALELDPNSARAHGVSALISLIYDYDFERARSSFEHSLRIDARDSPTLLSYAHFLVSTGDYLGAIDVGTRAAQIDPDDKIIHASVGWFHLLAGDVHEAIKQGENTARVFYPDFPPAHVILGWAYEAAHEYDNARKHYRISLQQEYSPAAFGSLGHLEAKLGNRAGGLSALQGLHRMHHAGKISYVPAFYKALIFAGLEDAEHCLNALEEALKQRCDWLIHLAAETRWDPVRKHPQFQELVRKIGMRWS